MHWISQGWLSAIQAKRLIAPLLVTPLILSLDTPTWAQGLDGDEVRELALRGV